MLEHINPIYVKTDEELLKIIGSHLKKRRINANLTQYEFAKATGISKDRISQIERTGKTSLASLVAISRKLGLLQQLLLTYEMPELTPIQKYDLEKMGAVSKHERKRVKK